MIELSIEEKAKRYDEIIEKLRNLHDDYDTVSTLIDIKEELENILPELKKSKEDKIRKGIIKSIMDLNSNWLELHGVTKENAIAWLKKQDEQKPTDTEKGAKGNDREIPNSAWSEEDNINCKRLLYFLDGGGLMQGHRTELFIWLKSLKDKVQPKQEWSEEDKKILFETIMELEYRSGLFTPQPKDYSQMINWLKSLRPQNMWKPSGEQMEALLYEVNAWDEDSVNGQNLKSLYQELKKLREE